LHALPEPELIYKSPASITGLIKTGEKIVVFLDSVILPTKIISMIDEKNRFVRTIDGTIYPFQRLQRDKPPASETQFSTTGGTQQDSAAVELTSSGNAAKQAAAGGTKH
jgi:hypothetical protein